MKQDRSFQPQPDFRSLVRACVIKAQAVRDPGGGRSWPEDPTIDMVLRAAVGPITTAEAPGLQAVVTEFVEALVPYSAAAALFNLALQLSFGDAATISLASVTVPLAGWVGEGKPIPVPQGVSTGATLGPSKLATIIPLTGEMMRSSNAEAIMRRALINNVGPSIDRAMFSAAAGSPGLNPPGLLFGIPPLTAASASGSKNDDMIDDIQTIAEALGPYGQIVLIASPKHAARLATRLESWPPALVSYAAGANLIGVAASALAVVVDPPRIEAGAEVVLHMESATPAEIVAAGGAHAAPVRSTFQTDSIGLRFVLPITWGLSAPAVAWLTPTW
jgi:Phage capsid family